MTFNPADDYDDDMLCLTVEGEFQGRSVTAYCCADSERKTYFENGKEVGTPVRERYGAPFKVDIVLHDKSYPAVGVMEPLRDEVGSLLKAEFEEKCQEVYEEISGTDSLEDILDLGDELLDNRPEL